VETLMAVVIGGIYAASIYLMLRRSLLRVVIGLVLMGQGANLLIFTAAGLTRANPPLVPEDALAPEPPYADPLPQALVLTAIVINFGMLALALVLTYRGRQATGTDDLDTMTATEE
jgi:multicomponent Na+:H+ antiporter subunit C